MKKIVKTDAFGFCVEEYTNYTTESYDEADLMSLVNQWNKEDGFDDDDSFEWYILYDTETGEQFY